MVMAALIAWIIGGSIVAALLGTFVGNPLTYPFFWVGTYEVGHLMLGGGAERARHRPVERYLPDLHDQLWPILKPMTLGALPVGLALAALSYVLVRPTVNAYQHRRRAPDAVCEAMEAR